MDRPAGAPEPEVVARAFREASEFPPFQPPIQRARRARDGTIWLMREEEGGAMVRWTLIEPDGEPRGHVDLPRRLTLLWSSGDTLWAVLPDTLDVPWLVRYVFRPE